MFYVCMIQEKTNFAIFASTFAVCNGRQTKHKTSNETSNITTYKSHIVYQSNHIWVGIISTILYCILFVIIALNIFLNHNQFLSICHQVIRAFLSEIEHQMIHFSRQYSNYCFCNSINSTHYVCLFPTANRISLPVCYLDGMEQTPAIFYTVS